MKKMIKNLMLVAVAAIAFVACSQEGNEVNILTKETTIEFTASLKSDDTRSSFGEKNDNAYPSYWSGNEEIAVLIKDANDNTLDAFFAYPKIVEGSNGKTATFTGTIYEDISTATQVLAFSGKWTNSYTTPNIYVEQTPTDNSVEESMHILKAEINNWDGSASNLSFKHAVAYGRLSLPAEYAGKMNSVKISFNDDVYAYTINTADLEGTAVWFACPAFAVNSFAIDVDVDGTKYTKERTDVGGKLYFETGKVTEFSISNLVEQEAPVAPEFHSASCSSTNGQDRYVTFTTTDDSLQELVINFYNCFDTNENTLIPGSYSTPYDNGIYAVYSKYNGKNIGSMNVTVSLVDNKYHIVIENVLENETNNLLLEKAVYTGTIENLNIPDLRTQLATPNVTTSISGKTITLTWDAVDNAEGYLIESSSSDIESIYTTNTTVTITVPSFDYYSFNVQAVIDENHETLRSSAKAYVEYFDPREYLPVPTNVTATVNGPNATISWDPVDGADGYQVSYYLDGNKEINVDSTSTTIEIGYSKTVYVYVFSIANETNEKYRTSNSWDAYVEVVTGNEPMTLSEDELTFSAAGESKTVEVTLNSIEGEITAESNNTQFTASVDGNIVTVTALENLSSDKIYGVITISCGDFSKTVNVTQKGFSNVVQDGSQANPYIYTCVVNKNSSGYYELTFTSEADGAKVLYLETLSTTLDNFKQGAITQDNNWYPSSCNYGDNNLSENDCNINFTRNGNTFSFTEIKIQVHNGELVYGKCESVVFP